MSTPATKPAAKKAATKKAAPKAGAEPSKSDLVRKLAKELKEGGQQPRPSVIVAELGKQGVKVAPAQVSIVLKKMGFRPLRKKKGGAKKSAPKAAGAVRAPKPAASSAVSLDELLAAKKAAASLGGTEKALAALQALKRIEE